MAITISTADARMNFSCLLRRILEIGSPVYLTFKATEVHTLSSRKRDGTQCTSWSHCPC